MNMETNMKTIYKRFKEGLQHSIKVIAEKHGISPLVVLTTIHGDIESEYMTELECIAAMIISPDWNSTIESDSLNTYINRRLIEEGYNTVPFEVLDFITEELQETLKPLKTED